MYNQVSRCFKTTGSDRSVCTILSDTVYLYMYILLYSVITLNKQNLHPASLFRVYNPLKGQKPNFQSEVQTI